MTGPSDRRFGGPHTIGPLPYGHHPGMLPSHPALLSRPDHQVGENRGHHFAFLVESHLPRLPTQPDRLGKTNSPLSIGRKQQPFNGLLHQRSTDGASTAATPGGAVADVAVRAPAASGAPAATHGLIARTTAPRHATTPQKTAGKVLRTRLPIGQAWAERTSVHGQASGREGRADRVPPLRGEDRLPHAHNMVGLRPLSV